MSEMQFEFSTFTPIYELQMIDRDSLDKLMLADIIEYCQERGIYNKYQSLLKSAKVPPPRFENRRSKGRPDRGFD